MGVKLLIAALLFSGAAIAKSDADADAQSIASADGTVLNHNTQMNTMLDTEIPYSTFQTDSVVCPTTRLSMALLPNYTKHMHSDSHAVTGVISLDMPLDLNGTVARCKQQQNALMAITDLERDLRILSVCIKAKKEGTIIDKQLFPWADKCAGISISKYQDALLYK